MYRPKKTVSVCGVFCGHVFHGWASDASALVAGFGALAYMFSVGNRVE